VTGASSAENVRVVGRITADGDLTIQNLTHQSGVIGGAGVVTLNGNTTWTSGRWDGPGTTINNGVVTINGGAELLGRRLDNAATVNIAAGVLAMFNNATFNNLAGATFDIQGNFNIGGGPTEAINNAGLLKKSAGLGVAEIVPALVNSGSVQVDAGTLVLRAGSSTGDFELAAGTTMTIGGPYTFDAGTDVTGAGFVAVPFFNVLTIAAPVHVDSLRIEGGTVQVDADLDVHDLAMTSVFGILTGPAAVSISGALTWTGGDMRGTGVTRPYGHEVGVLGK
jgi:hypothetical protein